jgi:hypothetical protein
MEAVTIAAVEIKGEAWGLSLEALFTGNGVVGLVTNGRCVEALA